MWQLMRAPATLAGGILLLLGCGGDQLGADDLAHDLAHDLAEAELPEPANKFSPSPVSFLGVGPPGDELRSPGIGDFDGDGKLDLVGLGNAFGYFFQITTALGKGDGTFGPGFAGFAFENWVTYAAADFNRDGKTDLVAAGGAHGLDPPMLKSALSNGRGFAEVSQYAGWGAYTAQLIAADVDGDRLPDLLSYSSGLFPRFSKGDGTGRFGIPSTGTLGTVRALAVDTNGDGTVDLQASVDMVTLALSTKGGSTSVTLDSVPQGMAGADFNRDGVPDIALLQIPPAGTGSEVRVMLGRGRFSVDPPLVTKLAPGLKGQSLVTGDWNGDGRADLAFALVDQTATGILLGKGDGSFAALVLYEGTAQAELVAGDWNGDGKTDLALGGRNLYSLLADGRGGLAAARAYHTVHDFPAIRAADLNRDGKMDLVLIGADRANLIQASTLLNQGADGFHETAAMNVRTLSSFAGAVTGDFNEDGKPDAVVATIEIRTAGGALHTLLGQGDGTFAPASNVPVGAFPYGLLTADLNKDGHLDLVSANAGSSDIAIFLGKGDGTFAAPVRYLANYGATSPQVGDVDKDGKLDVVVLNQSSDNADRRYDMFTILFGRGDGTVGPPTTVDVFSGYKTMRFDGFVMRDWDGDGKLDLAACATGMIATGPPTGDFQGLLLLRGDGRGRFVRGPLTALPDGCPTDLTGDVNGDGAADLVGLGKFGPSVLLSQGDGSFAAPQRFYATNRQIGSVLADMNGDRKLDIVEASARSIVVRLNTTP